jgi:hypothetical protein
MERMPPTWRSTLWARWLGWTVVFGLVVGGSLLAYSVLQPPLSSKLAFLLLAPSVLAAGLIGVRFRSWWWVAGPPAVFSALVIALLVSDTNARRHAAAVVGLGASVSAGYCIMAVAGVRGSRWLKAKNAGTTGDNLDGDASP